jgi:GT2 family glycosyltransferase
VSDLDVVVVNYRCHQETVAALARLGTWTRGLIWVVDNSEDLSETQALHAATRHQPWVRVLSSATNVGFGKACNLVFEKSRTPLILLLNPDARITPQDTDRLARALIECPRLGAVAPRVFWDDARGFLVPNGVPQNPLALLDTVLCSRWHTLARWRAIRELELAWASTASARPTQASRPVEVDFLSGAVLLVRRSAAQAAGCLFDPRFFMFFEDSDLSIRLRRAGYALAVVPDAQAVHTYRHKPFKATMMGEARKQYFAACFPKFFRLSGALARLDRLARPVPLPRWFDGPPAPLEDSSAFERATDGAAVLAWTPSVLMRPCIYRPDPARASGYSPSEWALLEPGTYVALLQHPNVPKAFWRRFEVAA